MDFQLTGSAGWGFFLFVLYTTFSGAAGLLATASLQRGFFVGERVLIGLTVGIVGVTLMTFLVSMVAGLNTLVVWLVPFVLGGIAYVLGRRFRRDSSRVCSAHGWGSRVDRGGFIVLGGSIGFFWLFADLLITWKKGVLATGIIDNWGDLPWHLGIITSFLSGGPIPADNPSLAGHPLIYPFLSDFQSAMLVSIGLSVEHSIEFPTVLLNTISMTLLFYFGYRLVRNRGAAMLAPLLFVLAGGLGFWWFLSDVYLANTPIWEMLKHIPARYTSLGEAGIRWINPTLAHLLPQRSLLFGFPLFFAVCILLWRREKTAIVPGILAGLLPLAHMHTFMALLMATGLMAVLAVIRERSTLRYWAGFFITAGIVALPQLLYFLSSRVDVGSAIRFEPGWLSEGENIIWFWLKNAGVIIPMILAAVLFRRKLGLRKDAMRMFLPFLALLVIGNLFLFSPLTYDTNKIFVFSFLLGMPFVALILVRLFGSTSWWIRGLLFRTLFVMLIFSGTLNLVHELQSGGWDEYTVEEIEMAGRIRSRTLTTDVFLSIPVHNNLFTLTGRAVVLGYPSHVYSHGIDPSAVEADIERIYRGEDDAEALLIRHGVDYVLVGPRERNRYGEAVEWFERYETLARVGGNVVYDVR